MGSKGGRLNSYEGIFVIKPDVAEEQTRKVAEAISGEIEKSGGKIEESTLGPRQRLCYPIAKSEDGHYLAVRFQAPPSALEGLIHRFRMQGEILRHMIVRRTKAAAAPAPRRTA
jgi:small subunit ribosomal protein S6